MIIHSLNRPMADDAFVGALCVLFERSFSIAINQLNHASVPVYCIEPSLTLGHHYLAGPKA